MTVSIFPFFFFLYFSTAAFFFFFLPKARRNYRWLIPINDVAPMCFSRTTVPTLAVGTCDRIVDPLHGLPWPLSAHRCQNIVDIVFEVGFVCTNDYDEFIDLWDYKGTIERKLREIKYRFFDFVRTNEKKWKSETSTFNFECFSSGIKIYKCN